MHKFCILEFIIVAVLLVFADANDTIDTELELQATALPTETVTPMALALSAVPLEQQNLRGDMAQHVEEQKIMKALAATQTQTATTTARAASAATTLTTVTLASSNAPATLTTTNDVDERVLSTTKPIEEAAEVQTDAQAKPQQQHHEPKKQQKQKLAEHEYDANMRKKQVLLFVEKETAAEATLATTRVLSKINAATLATTSATPANRETVGNGATKSTEVPNGNFESKSRADTLPLDKAIPRVGSPTEHAATQLQDKGNEAKTQIIKNAEELQGKRLNGRKEVKRSDEGAERKEERTEQVAEAVNAERAHEMAKKVFGSQLEAQQNPEIFQTKIAKEYRETTEPYKGSKLGPTAMKSMTAPTESRTLYRQTNVETVEKSASIEEIKSTTSDRLAKMNVPEEAKLAEPVTERNTESTAEDSYEMVHTAKQVKTTAFTTTTDGISSEAAERKSTKVVKPVVNAEKFTKITKAQVQKQSNKTTEELASQANGQHQKQQAKLVFENREQHENEQANEEKCAEEQQSKPNQLEREQSNVNKELMDRWQVQQEYNENKAIDLNENISNKRGNNNNNNKNENKTSASRSNKQNMNNNENKNIYNDLTNNKPYEHNDHVEYATVTPTTTITPTTATVAAAALQPHIYDLYPMRKEDFNTIIHESNEKLLRERTIRKPTEQSGIVEQQQQAEAIDMYNAMAHKLGHEETVRTAERVDEADAEAEVRLQQNLLPNEVDKMDNIILQRYDNINNLAATQRNINRRPITTTVTTAAINVREEGSVEDKEVTGDTQLPKMQSGERKSGELEAKQEIELRHETGRRLDMEQGKETVLKKKIELRAEQGQRDVLTQRHEPTHIQADAISDFTGKLLAEQDGVITEIEQKFRLNEFVAKVAVTATPTVPKATEAGEMQMKVVTIPPTLTGMTADHDRWHASNSDKSVSYSVNHKIQQANNKNMKNKYIAGYNNKEHVRLSPQHDFIERRVKKSFDFPMHRTASASDTLQMPHVDFANTKFNTGIGATSTQTFNGAAGDATSETTSKGSGSGAAMRAALGTHPEFSTTKFYNSKELYNEMMLHNLQRLKTKAKEMEQRETEARTASLNAPNYTQAPKSRNDGVVDVARSAVGVQAALSSFALPQNTKLETLKYVPGTVPAAPAANKAIMPHAVHMHSQQWLSIEKTASRSAVDMRANKGNIVMGDVGVSAGGNGLQDLKDDKRKEEEENGGFWKAEQSRKAKNAQDDQWQGVTEVQRDFEYRMRTPSPIRGITSAPHTANYDDNVEKPTKKYQQNFQRAKLLIKSLLLPTTVRKLNTFAATPTATVISAPTTAASKRQNVKQHNNKAPTQTPTPAIAPQKLAPSSDDKRDDSTQTAKTFDIMSLSQRSYIVTPSMDTKAAAVAAIGNIDDSTSTGVHTAMKKAQMWDMNTKWVNFDGSGAIMAVKRAQSSVAPTTRMTPITTKTTITKKAQSMRSIAPRYASHLTSTTKTTKTLDDLTTTPLPLIYPYPQLLDRTSSARLLSQPHDTTAAAVSSTTTTTTLAPSKITFVYQPSPTSTTTSTTSNHSKTPSKPIGRPRILSRLQEKINSLECEIQNVPSDSHLWRGNETHELLLPIMTSESCPYGGTDCSPLLASWEGEAEIQSGDILIVEINDTLLTLNEHNITNNSPTHNIQVYQVTRSGHEHCDVTEGILLDITPLMVDGRKLVTLYDKDLTEGVNLLIVVSELWGSQCIRLKVTTKTDNCGENSECSGKGVCYSNNIMEEYECQCCSGFAGPHCEEIDACTPSPCTNNGICVDLSQGHEGNSYQCLCPYGYTGKNCQYESDPCNSAECMNGGSCVGNSTHFRCDCTPGYTGPLCQHILNECESSPCVHGICVDQEDGFRCFCQPGFAGELCNFEYNECESNPCQNDGECIDHIGNFECRCTKGYTGTRCQIKVDFCANKPCPDGHRCIDHGNDFSCECPGGNNGLDCNQMPRKQCSENICKHGGTCWTSGASFYCACRPGYTGNMCEDEFVVETVVSSSEFMVDDTSARNFNDKTFGSSVVLKSPIELHNAYFGAGVLAAAVFIVAVVVAICHCKVNQTYRKFSTRSTTFFPILGFGRRSKSQSKLNKHWLSGKGLNGGGGGNGGGANGSSLRSSGSTTSLTRGHLPPGGHHSQQHQRQQQLQQQQLNGGQMHERPFQRHLAMNLENDMYYTVDFSENSQHSPLIQ